MVDPIKPLVEEYIEPSEAELKARGKRNFAIAVGLFGFVIFVLFLMLYKLGAFG